VGYNSVADNTGLYSSV